MSSLFGKLYGLLKDKKLGGKNGKLKCKCGNLRYKGVKLCPTCYHGEMKYFVCQLEIEENENVYLEEHWYLLDGIDIENALNRGKIFDVRYIDGQHYIMRRAINIKEFNDKNEAKEYYNLMQKDYHLKQIDKAIKRIEDILGNNLYYYLTYPPFGYGLYIINPTPWCYECQHSMYIKDKTSLYCGECGKTITLKDILIDRLKLTLKDLQQIQKEEDLPKWEELCKETFYD